MELDRDEATIYMVDSNLQRTTILPSEKAFSYKMRLEAMKRQGKRSDLTSTPLESKFRSDEKNGKDVGESREQIRRYIRLTELIQPLLELVDQRQYHQHRRNQLHHGTSAGGIQKRSSRLCSRHRSFAQSSQRRSEPKSG